MNDHAKKKHTEPEQTDATASDDVVILEEETTPEAVKKLREKLKKAVAEKQEYLDGWQRLKADVVNSKKADAEERERFTRFAGEKVLVDILPVMDSFDMAFSNRAAWESAPENWRKGVEYIYAQLFSALENHGVRQINPLGAPFDPREHDSIATIPTTDKAKNDHIAEVIQKGYRLHARVIRPAKVKVFHAE